MNPMSPSILRDTVRKLLPEAERFLCDLIRFPSTPGSEQEEMRFIESAFRGAGIPLERVGMTDALRDDPDYSDPVAVPSYDGRFNLRVARPGTGGGRSLLLNTHTDAVPPSVDMHEPWTPRIENGIVHGRGACDAKGQVATIYLLYRALDVLKARLRGDVLAHLVVEEEVGGNGTLAMARRGEAADGCIVMEPTEGKICTSIRGAVWFRIGFSGKAGHSGQAGQTRSALLMARDAIQRLEGYHAGLLEASRGFPLFDVYPNPMPITFGRLEAGNWPAAAPSSALLEGVLGFLPNKTKEQVCEEFRAVLRPANDGFFAQNVDVHFTYRHDASVTDASHDVPRGLLEAAGRAGAPLEVSGMTASCDAWLYSNKLGIPTVVYGPGTLKVAHSKDEQIAMKDISDAAEVLLGFVADYSGAE